MKNSMDGSKLQAQRQNLISQIDELVEERNSHLSRIDEFSEAKVFDLHWFSLNGALKFVRKIQKAMENSSKRFSQRQEVTLITGWNNRIPWNTSIKTTLLDIYGDAIRVAENNPGRLIWSFEKKWTYADHLF
uniref:SGNH domain-containing protein n=2 Tax=Caenorhabditis tropicalis TaxID=1561998 RepID=A0A1I7UWT3_9PELO